MTAGSPANAKRPPVGHGSMLADQRAIAQRVQEAFLPKTCPTCKSVRLAARHEMSNGIGGDLYDFVPLGEHRYSLVIGDVIGHDMTSALVMSLIFGAVHTAGPRAGSPIDVLELVNQMLCDMNEKMSTHTLVCSLFLGVVDADAQEIRYANAGHPGPLFLDHGGDVHELDSTCALLGVDSRLERDVERLDLRPMRRGLLYTDGVTEARRGETCFGEKRLAGHLRETREQSVHDAIDEIRTSVLDFADGQLADDMTLVLADFGDEPPHRANARTKQNKRE